MTPMPQATQFPCPHCGANYTLTPDYLAQYGGQATVCTTCSQQFVLPANTPLPLPPPGPQAGAPYYGGGGGGMPQPGGVLPYAGPGHQMGGVWRDGGIIVAHKGAALPYCCVKCGQPGDGRPIQRTFYWHAPIIYLTILAGLLVYVIVALCVRDSGMVVYALCKQHRARRRNGMLGGLGTLAAGVALFFVAGITEEPLWIPFGVLLFFGGMIWAIIASRTLGPSRIEGQFLWLKGAGEPFLRTLPPAQPPPAAYGGYAGAAPQYGGFR